MPQKAKIDVVTDVAPCGLMCSKCDSFLAKLCSGCYSESFDAKWECPVLKGEAFQESKELVACMNDKKVEQCTDCDEFEGCEIYEAMLLCCPYKKPAHDLKFGSAYLVKEKKPVLSFRMFIEMMLREKDGLCISRQHPSTIEKKLEKFNVERFWLTGIEGKDNIDPTNLGIISDSIIRYIRKHRNSVVILDGFELLVSHNDFSQVLRMVDHVIEQMMQHGAVFIMPVDDRTLEKKELALLERSMEVIEG